MLAYISDVYVQIGARIGGTIGANLVEKMGVNYKGVSETPLFMAYLYGRVHVVGYGIYLSGF